MHKEPRPVHCRGEADVARRQPPSGPQQHVALAKIEPLAPHVAAARGAFEHPHAIAVALGVLLNDDRVGARRHRRAGKDAGGFAGADMPAEPGAGRYFGDDPQLDRDRGQILCAHRVAVHRRYRERRLRPAGGQILGQNAADRIDD